MSTNLHATRLRRTLRSVVVAIVAAPLVPVSIAACSSVETDSVDAAAADAAEDSTSSGPCRAREPVDSGAAACGKEILVELAGDLSTCTFQDGGENYRFCLDVCGMSSCDRVGNSVRCKRPCAVDGRRYTGLRDGDAPFATSVGSYLARMAFYEAASVDAFELLARDLKALGAPPALVRSCRKASRDEVRHAQMAATLASANGASTPAPPTPIRGARDIEALATENAVEGCVRESFGVLIGMWQSRFAPTAELRAFFAAVTQDELRHAALSMRVDEWARARMSPEAHLRVEAARSRAIAETEASIAEWKPLDGLGLPSAAVLRELFLGWRDTTTSTSAAA